jgi:UPF0271 protein
MTRLDLNADLGEGGPADGALMRLVSSVNVCCAAHAGSATLSLATLRTAHELGLAIGAHPGYPDRPRFGRVDLDLPPDSLAAELTYQVGGLSALAQSVPVSLRYLKPHGALYHRAGRDPTVAQVVVAVAQRLGLAVMGMPGSQLAAAARGRVRFIAEGFADRRYAPDGSLVPRSQADALLTDPAEALAQARRLIASGVESLCFHGDTPDAVPFARQLRQALLDSGLTIAPVPLD